MTHAAVRIRPDTYVDSVQLMATSRSMLEHDGVEWATAVMGTPANVDTLLEENFDRADLAEVSANDVVLAVRASSPEQCQQALEAAGTVLTSGSRSFGTATETNRTARPRTLGEAKDSLSDANVAVISVPGPYAALEGHKALGNGLHVLLFSDNVSVEDEVALKARGEELGLFVMGPGAGTAMLGGAGLGFANVVRRGRVGVAAAAGTGAQEVMSLVDRWGAGISQVIGVGGRDLSEAVGGRMMRLALQALQNDPNTDVVLVVSKPPAPSVARALIEGLGLTKPIVVAFIGLEERIPAPANVTITDTMEDAVRAALGALQVEISDPGIEMDSGTARPQHPTRPARGHAVRGLFSGGTLCYEAMTILSKTLGTIHSNTPLKKEWSLPAPAGSHVCLDLGEEEYTRGRPHPMIDPEPRAAWIVEEGRNQATGVLLIDVVLGHGSHSDPASILAPACAEATSQGEGPVVVAYVLGTEHDPQGYSRQREQLRHAGCVLAPTSAAAARMAAELIAGPIASNPVTSGTRP